MKSIIKGGTAVLRALAATALIGLTVGLSGCGGTTGDRGPAGSLGTAQATGTIQGRLRDAVTQQPIAGALVDIGVATATTNAQGEFSMPNVVVPVDANNQPQAQAFYASINLRGVTSPVNMATTATPRYPDFYYSSFPVSFTSIYIPTGASGVTPIPFTGMVSTVDVTVGKLASSITGTVADSLTKQPVAAGYTVKLVSKSSSNSATGTAGTGGLENVVGTTTTDASGNFTFANVESLGNFRIDAWNADKTFGAFGAASGVAVTGAADGETKTLSIQGNNAVFVASTDALVPTIISVTPEQNSDVAPGATDVVFTFNEPIKQTPDTSTSPSIPTSLYHTVAVNLDGVKASNIARTLYWNTTFTQLTVSLPALAVASKYSVSLADTGTALQDAKGQTVDNIGTAGKGVLAFTSNGSTTPVAPALVAITNSAVLNFNTTSVSLDWMPVSGAKSYNVYYAQNFPGLPGQLQLAVAGNTLTSDYTHTVPMPATVPTGLFQFVSGANKLTYDYIVKSVSADGIESAGSTVVTAADTVRPTATFPASALPLTTYTITFSEPVNEALAETLANYQLAGTGAPTITSAELKPGLLTVTLTFSSTPLAGNTLSVSGVTDIAGNLYIVPTAPGHTF